jgi:hypothetical protein
MSTFIIVADMKTIKNLFAIITVMIVTQVKAQIPNYVPNDGLIGWWSLNGNATDQSSQANNGNINGATTANDRFGNSNNALSFDGNNDYVSLNDSIGNFGTSDFSITAWVNGTSFPNQTYSAAIFSKRNSPFNSNFITFGTNLGRLEIELNQGGSSYLNVQATSSLDLNAWYFVCVTKASDSVFLYINGTVIKSAKNTFTGGFNNTAIAGIGASNLNGSWSGYINAKIDDVGIWKRKLSIQEISNLYNACRSVDSVQISTNEHPSKGSSIELIAKATKSSTFQWQTNPCNTGWTNIKNNSTYIGSMDSILTINNIQLSNHLQPFRIIAFDGQCIDTSNIVTLQLSDTTIIIDTIHLSVTDTLIIDATLTGLTDPNTTNTFKVFPNPASTHITIDNGDKNLVNGYTVKIFDIKGQEVFNQLVNQKQFLIDLNTWNGKGAYLIQIIDTDNKVIDTRKIIIQ